MHPRLRFTRLLSRLQPTEAQLERMMSHRQTVRTRLSSSFDVAKIEPIGSHSRGTAIAHYSDLDLLVVLRRNEAKWGDGMVSSETVLRRVRNDLDSRYSATAVRGDQQAAVVNFNGGRERIDVVPALFSHFDAQKRPIYGIPNGAGGWLATSPAAHNQWLRIAHAKSGGKLFSVAQLLKHWRHARAASTAVSSFYLELWLANSGVCIGARSYPEILADTFAMLHKAQARAVPDPLGISGSIPSTKTAAQKASLVAAFATSGDHATRAIVAERAGKNDEATRQWNLAFNGTFA